MRENEGVTIESQHMHSRFNRIMAVLLWCGAAALAAAGLAADNPSPLPWPVAAAALIGYLAWAALWRPGIRVGDDGVDVRNVSHTVHVPWAALIQVDTRFALTLATPTHRYAVWAAPAPSALRLMFAGRGETVRERGHVGDNVRPGDLLGTDSGDAAMLVRDAWTRRIDAGLIEIGVADDTPARRRWDAAFFVTTAILLTVSFLATSAFG